MTTPEAADFDEWYEAIAASSRWDGLVREWLDLPATVEVTGYLSGSGLLEVEERLGLQPDQHLVEVGCGRAGYGMALIGRSGGHLTGVDFSAAALRAAESAATKLGLGDRAQFRLGELSDTGLPDGAADAVLSVDAIQYAPSVSEAAIECHRILRPGGLLVATSWEPVSAEAAKRLPPRIARMDLQRDLVAAGFGDVSVSPRPDWHATEVAFWKRAAVLDAGEDPAVADLQEEAIELLPLADALQRVLAVARA